LPDEAAQDKTRKLPAFRIDEPHSGHEHHETDESATTAHSIPSWRNTPLEDVMDEELKITTRCCNPEIAVRLSNSIRFTRH